MTLHHSADTHQSLLVRIPQVTGRSLTEWLQCMENGPGLVRFEDRVTWLQTEYDLPHGHAVAIVQEHDRRRAAARA